MHIFNNCRVTKCENIFIRVLCSIFFFLCFKNFIFFVYCDQLTTSIPVIHTEENISIAANVSIQASAVHVTVQPDYFNDTINLNQKHIGPTHVYTKNPKLNLIPATNIDENENIVKELQSIKNQTPHKDIRRYVKGYSHQKQNYQNVPIVPHSDKEKTKNNNQIFNHDSLKQSDHSPSIMRIRKNSIQNEVYVIYNYNNIRNFYYTNNNNNNNNNNNSKRSYTIDYNSGNTTNYNIGNKLHFKTTEQNDSNESKYGDQYNAINVFPKNVVRRTSKQTNINSNKKRLTKGKVDRPKNNHLARLETIKYQILTKLGLKQRPNITHTLPKHVIIDMLTRADDSGDGFQLFHDFENGQHKFVHKTRRLNESLDMKDSKNVYYFTEDFMSNLFTSSSVEGNYNSRRLYLEYNNNNSTMETANPLTNNELNVDNLNTHIKYSKVDKTYFLEKATSSAVKNNEEPDDFYGRTRQIILFAETGSLLNRQYSIEFLPINTIEEENKLEVNFKKYSAEKLNMWKRKRRRRRRRRKETKTMPTHFNKQNVDYENIKTDNGNKRNFNLFSSNLYSIPVLRIRQASLWIKIDLLSNKKAKASTKKKQQQHEQQEQQQQNQQTDRQFTIWIFRLSETYDIDNHMDSGKQIKLCAMKNIHMSALGWQKIDLTSTVRQWYAEGAKSRLRLLIDCSGCEDRIDIHLLNNNKFNVKSKLDRKIIQKTADLPEASKIRNNSDTLSNMFRPFLVIYTDPNAMKRVRRRAVNCSGAIRGSCCKEQFYVNFTELGWDDWIIAPKGYNANYCQGDCNNARTPDNFQSPYSFVIEEYRKIDRLSGFQSCCTPLKFSSISIIYYEESQRIIKRDLPKMVVEECGCP